MTTESQRGFTLIELMVVIVILGALIGIVGPNIVRSLAKSRRDTARIEMAQLGNAVDTYRIERKALPADLEVLTERDPILGEPYIRRVPKDPWDQAYEYQRVSRRVYEIRCLGSDGEANTEDDLVHPVVIPD